MLSGAFGRQLNDRFTLHADTIDDHTKRPRMGVKIQHLKDVTALTENLHVLTLKKNRP